MPNFAPLRRYVFSVVDRWISRYHLEPPFLEVGCGTGELALHLARRGWQGIALDSSAEALGRAHQSLAAHPQIRVVDESLDSLPDGYARTLFLMDVLEHVDDDTALLGALAKKTAPGGHLVLLTPVNPDEWGHDDDVYGHVRRYRWAEVPEKLSAAGFTPLAYHNVTFPFIWALRRMYLRFIPRAPAADRGHRTAASSFSNPWSKSVVLRAASLFFACSLWWAPLFWIQDLCARRRQGHAALFIAQKNC